MSILSQTQFALPGMGPVLDANETAFQWNKGQFMLFSSGDVIDGSSRDPGNTADSSIFLRAGLPMGKALIGAAAGNLVPWDPAGTDGRQLLYSFLPFPLRTVDYFQKNLTPQIATVIYGFIRVGGLPAGSNALFNGLLNPQLAQQSQGRFFFDTQIANLGSTFPALAQQTKTGNYQLIASDCGTLFDNLLATGPVVFTLPPIAPGFVTSFVVRADQNLTVASFEGSNILWLNSLTRSSLAFQTAAGRLGGLLKFFTSPNPAGLVWQVENLSAGPNAAGGNLITPV